MMGLGVQEMIFIFGAALLLFGPRKLPEIGRTLGKGLAEFRKASAELKRSLDAESIEKDVRETRQMIADNDPRKYIREAAELDERRVARTMSKNPLDPEDSPVTDDEPTADRDEKTATAGERTPPSADDEADDTSSATEPKVTTASAAAASD